MSKKMQSRFFKVDDGYINIRKIQYITPKIHPKLGFNCMLRENHEITINKQAYIMLSKCMETKASVQLLAYNFCKVGQDILNLDEIIYLKRNESFILGGICYMQGRKIELSRITYNAFETELNCPKN